MTILWYNLFRMNRGAATHLPFLILTNFICKLRKTNEYINRKYLGDLAKLLTYTSFAKS